MRLVGFCPECGSSFDGEFVATGAHRVYPMMLCECTGLIAGMFLARFDGAGMPTAMEMMPFPAGIDADG